MLINQSLILIIIQEAQDDFNGKLKAKITKKKKKKAQKERNLLSASSPAPPIFPALVLLSAPVWRIYCYLASFLGLSCFQLAANMFQLMF